MFLARSLSALLAALLLLSAFLQLSHAQLQPAEATGARDPAVSTETAATTAAAPRVVVVGAGLAGISAARALVDAGIKDVVILEGRGRPGGRLHSVETSAGASGGGFFQKQQR